MLMLEGIELYLFGFGWFPIIIVYIFKQAGVDPEGETRFCCLPFLIKRKHLPWVLVVFCLLFQPVLFLMYLLSALVGYYQSMVRKSNIVLLPLTFYKKV